MGAEAGTDGKHADPVMAAPSTQRRHTMKTDQYTADQIALEARLSESANDEGTIQAADMLRIAPHHRPELHTVMSVSAAFEAITGKEYDAEFFCNK
jgi:hypothetical protein